MNTRFLLPATAIVALCAGGAAYAAGPAANTTQMGHKWGHQRMDPAKMAERMKQHCADRYARKVGEMAYLKTRLNLSGNQQSAFEAWKDAVLKGAKSAQQTCESRTPPSSRPALADRMKMRAERMEQRAQTIRAEIGPLTQLTATLNPEQTRILDRAVMMHGHHGMGHHGMRGRGMGHHGWHHGHRGMGPGTGPGMGPGNGPADGPPPPADDNGAQ